MPIQLSYSASEKYKMSPRAYYLHYMLKLRPIELSSALFFGNAVDLGLNELLNQKKDGQPIDLIKANDIFLKAWQTGNVNGEEINLSKPGTIKYSKADYDESILTSEDRNFLHNGDVDQSWVSLKRKGLIMLEAYAEQIIPKIKKVHFVQTHIKLNNEVGDSFIGIVDFCAEWEDGRTYIFDNKTSSVKYSADSVETSPQLATYFEAFRDQIEIYGAGYIVVPKKIRKTKMPRCEIDVRLGQISEKLIEQTFIAYEQVLDGIKLGKFECRQENCCSMPWPCAYKRYCDSGGQDMTGLVFHKERDKK